MKKPKWKVFELDEMTMVAARTLKDAINWYMKECGIGEEDIYPWEVNLKQSYMMYPVEEIPSNRIERKTKPDCEGFPCVEIPLKKALRYQIRLHKPKEPFIICSVPW